MFAGIDGVGKVVQPEGSKYAGNAEVESALQNAHPEMFFFYFACIMIAGYLILNMFVSVFVDGYLNASEVMKHEDSLQAPSPAPIRMVFQEPETPLRKAMSQNLNTTNFDIFSAILIVMNIMLMAFESFKQSTLQTELSDTGGLFFALVFGAECLAKLYAFGASRFFANGWNKFDFTVVIVSFIGIAIDNLGESVVINPTMLRIMRIFRIFRLLRAFKVFKAARGLQIIIKSMSSSLPSLLNLGTLLLLVFFMFAALATSLFGTVCVRGEAGLPGLGAVRCLFAGDHVLDLHANFRHMGESFASLFRCSTGDDWRSILDVLGRPPAEHLRPLSTVEWGTFVDTLGYDPLALPSDHRLYNPRLVPETGRMEMAKVAIRHWNASVHGLQGDPDWPAPNSVPQAANWINIAQMALPGCLTDWHVEMLQAEGLLDCSQVSQDPTAYAPPSPQIGNRCQSTCAVGGEYNYVLATVFFGLFLIISNFVILQLVIGVLMAQLQENMEQKSEKVAGCDQLPHDVLQRIVVRFQHNALKRLRYLKSQAGTFLVTVHDIRNFTESSGFLDRTDPYVELEFGGQTIRTSTKKNAGGNVIFDETMRFSKLQLTPRLPTAPADSVSVQNSDRKQVLTIRVLDKDRITSDDLLGEREVDLGTQVEDQMSVVDMYTSSYPRQAVGQVRVSFQGLSPSFDWRLGAASLRPDVDGGI